MEAGRLRAVPAPRAPRSDTASNSPSRRRPRRALRIRHRLRSALAAALLCLTALAAAATWAPVPTASAASNGAWSIFPCGVGRSLFDFSLPAGHSISDCFTVANDTTHALSFAIYPADGYDVSAGGGFALKGRGQKNVGVGAWIRLPKTISGTYRLPALTQAKVHFTLSVPADAPPGDQAGGIVALNVSPAPSNNSRLRVTVHQGVGVRIYLHVLGPVHPKLSVAHLHAGTSVPPFGFLTGSSHADVQFDLRDTGNTIFSSVEAKAYATNVFGQRVETFRPRYLAAVLPGSSEVISEPQWHGLPIAGPVTVHLELVASGVHQHYATTFWVVPWVLIVVVVLLLVVLVVLVLRRGRRRRRRKAAAPVVGSEPEPEAGAGPASPEVG